MKHSFTLVIVTLLLFTPNAFAESLGTGFTYQGELKHQGLPANGPFDFKFDLFDVALEGDSLTAPVLLEDVNVQDGVFTVELDFGSEVFDGTQLFLGIAVREGPSVGAHTDMNPRQKLTAAPYASSTSNGEGCNAITALPAVIDTPGVYCFTGHLSTAMATGDAITILVDDVVIDLNGWTLDGLVAGPDTETNGMYANQRKNISIRNGAIRGFYQGVFLEDVPDYTNSNGHLVEDLRVDRSTYAGIWLMGRNSTVRRNQVVGTIGTIPSGQDGAAVGVFLGGAGGRIIDNHIHTSAVSNIGEVRGIFIHGGHGTQVQGNLIDDASEDPETITYGMHLLGSTSTIVRGNNIQRVDIGVEYDSHSSGKYMDNLTSGVTENFRNNGAAIAVGINN